MASPVPDLAVVICNGSYHTPAPYGPLLEALKAKGIDAYCPQLPTADLAKLNVGDVINPDFDLEPPAGGYPQGEEDTKAVLGVLRPLVDEGNKVLIIAHSSGGWVATEAARPELQAKTRAANGARGGKSCSSRAFLFEASENYMSNTCSGIVGIIYMGAFVVPVGDSVHSFFQPKDGNAVVPPFMTFHVCAPEN